MNKYLIIICTFVAWNLIVLAIYGADKSRARQGQWRISEKALLAVAFLFGGVGALGGMHFFRHKTKHAKFRSLIPLATIINLAALAAILYYIS